MEIISGKTVNTGDYNVSSGTSLVSAVLGGNGTINVFEGGVANSTTVNSCNSAEYKGMYIFSGGTALNTQIKSGGVFYLYGQGSASGGVVSSGGTCHIREYSYARDLVVMPGATLSILSGATVNGLKDSGGYVYIQDGAQVTFAPNTIDNVTVNDNTYNVFSGTTLTNATVAANGVLTVNNGGVIQHTTVNSCNTSQYKGLYVSSGGVAIDTTVNSGGALYLYNNGRASGGVVSSGGICQINASSYVKDLVVKPGATLNVLAGATVDGLKDSGGYVYIQDGAKVTFAANTIDNVVVNNSTYNVFSGTTLTNATVAGNGIIGVSNGGVVEGTKVNSCNASGYKGLYVYRGGVAIDTTVNNGGAFYLYNYGSASGGVVSSGGLCQINDASYIKDLVVMPGGTLTILSGATVDGLKDSGGYVYIQDGAKVTFAANTIDKVTVNSGDYKVFSGTTLTNATVTANGTLAVSNGGVIQHTTVNSCSTTGYKGLYVYSGGVAIDTTINNGGVMYLYDYGSASGIDVAAGGACQVNPNATVQDIRVQSGAYLTVSAGATVYNITEDGGTVTVQDGARVTFAERVISGTTINNGATTIHEGTTMLDTVIVGAGKLNLIGGGKAVSTTVNSCDPDGGLVIYSGGTAVGNVMNNAGFTYIFSGGTAIDNTIHSGGSMTIFGGAVMKNVNVESGGLLYLSSGAVLTGRVRVATLGAYIFIDDVGATIDFDISELNPSGDQEALLDDFERIRPEPKTATDHVPIYTITVSDDQSIGTYTIAIARQRVDFPTITVKNTEGKTIGTLAENTSFNYNGLEYRLSYTLVIDTALQQGVVTLLLHIGDDTNDKGPAMPVVSADTAEPAKSVTVTASFDGTASKQLYSFDATTWQNYSGGVTVTENCRVYFRAENRSGASGIASYTVRNIISDEPTGTFGVKSDIDGNGVSDVMFQYTGGDYQLGFWMNGTNAWKGNGLPHPAEWEVLGAYDMNSNGNADSVLVGNVVVNGVKGAYIGYYADSNDTDANWMNIGYLNNADDIDWKNKVGNLTGNEGKNSIVWYAPELYALGVWTDGTDTWVTLSNSFGGDVWKLVGCGDFNGDGKDSVLMSYNGGQLFYAVGLDGSSTSMGNANWSGWDVRAIGDFSGDGKDDLVLFHKDSGSMVMFADGNADNYTSIGQLNASDWFVVGAGDYNGDKKDDLLVRQYSTGMLGYYANGDTSQWVEMGRGVDMNWTVIA